MVGKNRDSKLSVWTILIIIECREGMMACLLVWFLFGGGGGYCQGDDGFDLFLFYYFYIHIP